MSKRCFLSWMAHQDQEMQQLTNGINQNAQDKEKLTALVQTCLKSYQGYCEQRLVFAKTHPSSVLSPSWCTSFENTNLWIGGCRPTLFIQLTYTLCGIDIESELYEFLRGVRKGNLGELTSEQLTLVNDLQMRTIQEENKLSARMASMQEEMGGKTVVQMANELDQHGGSTSDVDRVFDSYDVSWVSVLEEADDLRLNTLKELVSILTPFQAVEFLMAGKKLHLSIHEWCKRREH
ncbi:2-deoxyglucose-6-phosphatase [Ranunculus cassubicifolius]